ncbi:MULTISPECIES: class Ib ribonucleoside-diphosphate reductase assembly flavoprotein NrdI [Jeotgalicoccus]|uniref:class Ib ribonucleoside-diphosphate reductase assembly flavoprotein NrdI n=1 Tax=Jeotgalicoccus TaxID=227979 RepID=UPI0003FD6574|nr:MULTISPECIES: class Ib ribonucleoside-diphosphate reductase assembly flavoprotein NrdI [Jeotgalicoccus]QQD84087.1 class Ib ribonucleoside-diphosphate reductase assembly flavoprotein NrdI [Jeotgalicoccus sp. ATCC 8456]
MIIAYYSMTGNIRRFLNGIDIPDTYELYQITADNVSEKIGDRFILVTPTYGFGAVPDIVSNFLKVNAEKMFAVVSSGNRNWGRNYARAGEYISDDYNVPLLMKFELHGSPEQREQFLVELERAGELHESIR